MKKLVVLIVMAVLTASAFAQSNFQGKLFVYPQWTQSKVAGASTTIETTSKLLEQAHTHGTNAYQMNGFAQMAIRLTNGESRTISLAALTNSFGSVLAFDRINVLCVRASSNNVGPLVVGNAATDPFSGWLGDTNQTVLIRPGGLLLLTAPDATGLVSTGKLLKVQNAAIEPDALFVPGHLGIDAIASAFKTTNAAEYAVGGSFYSKPATTNLVFSNADTINVESNAPAMWGVWRVQVNAAGTISTLAPATNQVYTNESSAIAALPAVAPSNISLGFILVASPTSTAFVANSTPLTDISTFSNSPTTLPNVEDYDLYFAGAH